MSVRPSVIWRLKPADPRRNGSWPTIFPFGLTAEFLARQNRRPPPSSA
jgi:hypothetical protein